MHKRWFGPTKKNVEDDSIEPELFKSNIEFELLMPFEI